jgi:transposase
LPKPLPIRIHGYALCCKRFSQEASVSLPQFSTQAELFSTAGLSSTLFASTDRYRIFARVVYPILAKARGELEECYCLDNGRVAIEPVLMLGVSILQYIDAMPDRKAVEMLQYHAGWNFALNRQLGDPLFHSTSLVNFRQRLLEKDKSALAFKAVLDALAEAGLVSRKSRQRLDSTQMFGLVSRMSRLDCVREALRLGLQELEASVAPESRPGFWLELWERYVESQADYRIAGEALARKLIEAGHDSKRLLDWALGPERENCQPGPQLLLLQRVFHEQFELVESQAAPKNKERLNSDRVQNPNEPEATYAVKGQGQKKKDHVGYKVQVAETVTQAELAPGEPTQNFLTGIVTHAAHESDEAGALKMEAEQAQMGLEKPPVLYVDGAYVSGEKLAEAEGEGRVLMGPAQPAPGKDGRYTSEDFDIRVEERRGICPAGHVNTQCSRLEEEKSGKISYRFEWGQHCADCPLRERCVGPEQKHRTLVVGEYHSPLQARRKEQKGEEFIREMKHRAGIEGTQSELVRAHGMRRARYRGLAKVRLQNYFAGAACNAKRWINRKIWEMSQGQAGEAPATR